MSQQWLSVLGIALDFAGFALLLREWWLAFFNEGRQLEMEEQLERARAMRNLRPRDPNQRNPFETLERAQDDQAIRKARGVHRAAMAARKRRVRAVGRADRRRLHPAARRRLARLLPALDRPAGLSRCWGRRRPDALACCHAPAMATSVGDLSGICWGCLMKLTYSEPYRVLQSEVRAFIAKHGHLSPKPGGGRQKPSRKALDWQKLLLEHGYFAPQHSQGSTAASACRSMSWSWPSSPRRSPRPTSIPAS